MAKVQISVAGMTEVVHGLERAWETLRVGQSVLRSTLDEFDLDTSRAAVIGWSVDWVVDELPGVRRRLAMAQELEGQDPTWTPGTVSFDESAISTLRPEAALALGRQTAAALRDDAGSLDEALVDALEANFHDPYFASGFARALSATELATLAMRLSAQQPRDAAFSPSLAALAKVMGSATRATGELALPSGYAKEWVEVITGQVQDPRLTALTVGSTINPLSRLVTSGHWDASFLASVVGGVVDLELALSGGQRPSSPFSRGADDSSVVPALPSTFGLVDLMKGLGRNSQAAQQFFTQGSQVPLTLTLTDPDTGEVTTQDLTVSERLRYLVDKRVWAFEAAPGAAFGQALEAATTYYRDREDTGRTSAEIATQAFALLGNRTGTGAHDARGPDGILGPKDGGWAIPEGLRGSVAQMLASYGTDVWETIVLGVDDLGTGSVLDRQTGSEPDSPLLFGPGLPHGAVLDKVLLGRLVGTLGEDESHTNTFLLGLTAASNLAMSTAMRREADASDRTHTDLITGAMSLPSIENTIMNSAQALGWTVRAAYQGEKDTSAIAASQAKAFAWALSLGAELPLIPKIPEENSQWLLDQVTGKATEQTGDVDTGAALERYAELDANLPRATFDNVLNLLLQTGYLTEEHYAAANGSAEVADGGTRYLAPPADAFVRDSDPPAFDVESQAYKEWVRFDAPRKLIEETVRDSYRAAWPNVPDSE